MCISDTEELADPEVKPRRKVDTVRCANLSELLTHLLLWTVDYSHMSPSVQCKQRRDQTTSHGRVIKQLAKKEAPKVHLLWFALA